MHILLVTHVLDVALLCEAPFLKGWKRPSLDYVQQASCLMPNIVISKCVKSIHNCGSCSNMRAALCMEVLAVQYAQRHL